MGKPNLTKRGDIVLEMRGITKRFPGVVANDHVNFDVRAGEVHALLGENGAGKTTLMNILYGLYQPDEGEILIKGKRVEIKSPRDAINLGIGMVHQHFMLIPSLTVAENILLGFGATDRIVLNREEAAKRIIELSESYGLKVDPNSKIWQLSVGERQRVEIIKALYRGAEILILDEPTAVLTPPEIKEIMKIIRRMADDGLAVVPFITHKLPEVMTISDRVTVLRHGKVVARMETRNTNEQELAEKMVGRPVLFRIKRIETIETVKKDAVLKVNNISALDDRGLTALRNVSFTLRKGEILGVAGVSGNGQRELEEVLMGLRKVVNGKIYLLGSDVTNSRTDEIIKLGAAFIPEDRLGRGLALDLSVAENLILTAYSEPPFAFRWFSPFKRHSFLNIRAINEYAERLIQEYEITTPSIHTPVRNLSGGNLQRIILARELSRRPKLLVAAQPTRGLDVGATEFIRNKLMEQKGKGAAILLISEDLDEVMSMSDRIAVMYRGEMVGVVSAAEAKIEDIGLMMAGAKRMSLTEA